MESYKSSFYKQYKVSVAVRQCRQCCLVFHFIQSIKLLTVLAVFLRGILLKWHEAIRFNRCIHAGKFWLVFIFNDTYELINLAAPKFSLVNKLHIFQCMGKLFYVELQKFHTKYLTHTLKETIFFSIENLGALKFYELVNVFEMPHTPGVWETEPSLCSPVYFICAQYTHRTTIFDFLSSAVVVKCEFLL